MLVADIFGTWFGDANLDGQFDSGDFVTVFQEGLFETNEPATWGQGDWNVNGVFDSADFVTAFRDGGYDRGSRNGALVVPEPTTSILLAAAMFLGTLFRRLQNRDKCQFGISRQRFLSFQSRQSS